MLITLRPLTLAVFPVLFVILRLVPLSSARAVWSDEELLKWLTQHERATSPQSVGTSHMEDGED